MRVNRVSIDIIDNGYVLYYYAWNEEKNEWTETNVKCCQDKTILMSMLDDHFSVKVGEGNG